MRESTVWTYLDRNRPNWLAIERLETKYPPGLADCFWTDKRPMDFNSPAVSGWLELKYLRRAGLTTKTVIPDLRPDQTQFLVRQAKNGVSGGILMRHDAGWMLWKAPPDEEWSNMVRGPIVLCPPLGSWTLDSFRVIHMIDLLRQKENHAWNTVNPKLTLTL